MDTFQEIILSKMLPGQIYTSTNLREKTGLEYLPILGALKVLVSKGHIIMTGKKKGTRYKLATGTTISKQTEVLESSIEPEKVEVEAEVETAEGAVKRWLTSPESISPTHAQEVAREISRESGIPLPKIQTTINEAIKAGKIHREFKYELNGGLYRVISRNN